MTAAAANDPVVELCGVTKSYGTGAGATVALRDLSVRVARGEFVAIMGPSGSGKTTLLTLIAGLDTPDQGYVVVDGARLDGRPDHRLADMRLTEVALVFQDFNLIPAFTVEQNVAWPLRFAGYSPQDVRQRTLRALERVGVVGREHRRPAELSGGEQQRVAIARAIAAEPTILLADEPTGNLDSSTGRLILDLLRTLNQERNVTIIMVTHNLFAAAYGDRSLELRDGRIVQIAGARHAAHHSHPDAVVEAVRDFLA